MSAPASTTPAADAIPRVAGQWAIFATCAVAIFFVWLDSTSMPAMRPVFRSLWPQATPQQIGWVLNAYSLSFALALVPMGWVSDRYGSLRVLVTGLSVYGLTCLACAATTRLDLTLAARVLQGLAAASLPPSALSLALRHLPPARHGRALYLWAGVGGIAAILGPLLSAVALHGGYALFYGLHALTAAAALVSLHRLRGRLQRAPLPCSGAAPWRELRHPGFAALQLGTLFFGCAFSLVLLDTQTQLAQGLGYSPPTALAHLSVAIVVCVFTSIGLAFSPLGRHRMALSLGGIATTVAAGWLLAALDCAPYAAPVLLAVVLAGAGLGMTLPNLPSLSSHWVSAQAQGLANAVNQSSRHLGSAAAVVISQGLANPGLALGAGLSLCGLCSALLLLASLRRGPQAGAALQVTH